MERIDEKNMEIIKQFKIRVQTESDRRTNKSPLLLLLINGNLNGNFHLKKNSSRLQNPHCFKIKFNGK